MTSRTVLDYVSCMATVGGANELRGALKEERKFFVNLHSEDTFEREFSI